MKRLLLLLIFVPLMSVTALCQKGLNIAQAFDGRYSKQNYAEEVTVKGDMLLGIDIQYYRALTVANAEATEFIRNLVIKDGTLASKKEVTMRGGKLAYGFYELPPAKAIYTSRFIIFYENNGKGALIYMEGDASLSQIKKTLMKK